MQLKPRDYQQEAFDLAKDHLRKSAEPGILNLATGAGKSIIVAMLADWLHRNDKRALVLTHSSDLVSQNHAKYLLTGNDAGIFSAKLGKKNHRHQVIFAGVQSIVRSLERFEDPFSLILIDECFHGDTLISTSEGQVRIVDMAARKLLPNVLCIDDQTGELFFHTPKRCFQNGTKNVSLLKHSDGEVKCTNTHKFYSSGRWLPASELQPGMKLSILDLSSGFLTRLRRALAAVAKELFQNQFLKP